MKISNHFLVVILILLMNCPKKTKKFFNKNREAEIAGRCRDVLLISEWNMLLSFSMFLSRTLPMQFTHIKIAGVVYGMFKRSILHFFVVIAAASQLDYFFIFFFVATTAAVVYFISLNLNVLFYFISLDTFFSLRLAAS